MRDFNTVEQLEYNLFIDEVMERDGWKCQKCESPKNLTIHHKEFVRNNPDKIYDKDNCITLCQKCHTKLHQKTK